MTLSSLVLLERRITLTRVRAHAEPIMHACRHSKRRKKQAHTHTHTHIHARARAQTHTDTRIYIYRERERGREREFFYMHNGKYNGTL